MLIKSTVPFALKAIHIVTLLFGMLGTGAHAETGLGTSVNLAPPSRIEEPQLYADADYREYWEQQFLFDNGTMVTSQFLIANFPFSKRHSLMVATLKQPGEKTIIVKNGRKRSGWHFNSATPQLSIYQHELSGTHPHYRAKLHNTAAEIDITYTASHKAVLLVSAKNTLGLPEISILAPMATATGHWRPGPEIGGAGPEGSWKDLGSGKGYALHVLQRKNLNSTLRRWFRFTALSNIQNSDTANKAGALEAYTPILHRFEAPSGDMLTVLILLSADGPPIRFDTVQFTNIKGQHAWRISAAAADVEITGILEASKTVDDFILSDHLNTLEKMAAGTMANIARHRYQATYSLALKQGDKQTMLQGRALAEEILLSEIKKKQRRQRR
ncbi:MAG: hypothetical protein KUG56_05225 [Kordiimonadaceae bacterium]|nr:hypothetical protein [Kordiimonadaceae bacterium]